MSKKTEKKTVTEPTLAQQAEQMQLNKDAANAAAMQDTEAGAIWNEIKNKDIEMFALPGQKVFMHAHPIPIEPTKLYLTTNSSAVLPSLETSLGRAFTVELVDRFVIVSRAVVPLTRR